MARVKTRPGATELSLELDAPGMTAIHRAGLGGLACTLKSIERGCKAGTLLDEEAPGGPWESGPPWDVNARSINLRFGHPAGAREYLRRLFSLAFQIKDGLIYLPGQYPQEPALAVRAELQLGLTLTFLQHGKTRHLAKQPTTFQHDPVGDGLSLVTVEYRVCSWYKHQDGWQGLTEEKTGWLSANPVEVIGPLNPGAVVRHVAFTADTRIEEPPSLVLPLYFALVGCLALPVNRGVGVLVVPEVEDLPAFVQDRRAMTPAGLTECRIAGASDAALQAVTRLRMRGYSEAGFVPDCLGVRFEPTPWASQQKSRVQVATVCCPEAGRVQREVETADTRQLDRFAIALADLAPRVWLRQVRTEAGRGRQRQTRLRDEAFLVDSIVRPLVADNLAKGKPWYEGFVRLMTDLDETGRPLRDRVRYEVRGLHAMTNNPVMWDNKAERRLVDAVHEALRCRFGQIADENRTRPQAMRNRFGGEYERWRLAFVGARTADQFRDGLADLFSRAGYNRVLRDYWREILPLLNDRQWRQARDLALLGLASYSSGQADTPPEITPTEENPQ